MLKLIEKNPNISILKELYKNEDDLNKAWTKASYPFKESEWKNWFEGGPDKDCYSLYLEEEGRIVGHGAVLDYTSGAAVSYLCFLIIDPTRRGEGLGKELVSKMCHFVKEKLNKKEVYLIVDPKNIEALNCYISSGFSYVDGDISKRYKKML